MRQSEPGDEIRPGILRERSEQTPKTYTRREFLFESMRTAALAGSLPAALSLFPSGCGRQRRGLRRELVQGSLRVGLDADVPTLDPAMHRSRTVESVVRNICDGLVARDARMEYVPQLAESWSVEGESRWVFKLREGVRFHTGEPFTAEDVKFTLDRIIGAIKGLEPSPRKDLLVPVAGTEVVDEHTVAVITEGPYPILHKKLVFQEICPKAYFERVGPEEFGRSPVGAGPFKLVEWQPGERIVLERFEDYYGGSPDIPPVGPAELEGVIFRPLEEAVSRLATLEAEEIEVAVRVPPDHAERMDRLLAEADRSMEPEARRQKYVEVQRILHDDIPTCFHFALEELYGVSDRVVGFEARPDGMLPMHDVSLRTQA